MRRLVITGLFAVLPMLVLFVRPVYSDDIFAAAQRGDLPAVKAFLKADPALAKSANPEGKDTPLHLAAAKGSADVVTLLLANGADINALDEHQETPLFKAVAWEREAVVRLLLARKADLRAHSTFDGHTLLSTVMIGFNEPIAKMLVQAGANVNDPDEGTGRTPLHMAARHGDVKAADFLLAHGAIASIPDSKGLTALDLATESDQVDVALILSEPTPKRDILVKSRQGDAQAVAKLLQADPQLALVADKFGRTPLHKAARYGREKVVKVLVKAQGTLAAKDADGDTPLHAVLAEEQEGTTRMLQDATARILIENGADVNAVDLSGDTPLILAAGRCSTDTVKLLLSKGANVKVKNETGWSPFLWAAATGSKEKLHLFIKAGADPKDTMPNGWTGLHWSVTNGSGAGTHILVENGVNINARDKRGATPLAVFVSQASWAREPGKGEQKGIALVEMLIKLGADVNAADNKDNTPMSRAVEKNWPAMIEILKKHGAK